MKTSVSIEFQPKIPIFVLETQLNCDNAQFQLPCRLIRIDGVVYMKRLKWGIEKGIYFVVSDS
ncbi:hypothetical protein [uncultured Vibrio sp.]|uniref:hypothetical protein n=1 Tax=uncultured Vibrio sp. TaxID=114054 RepID=UPI00260948DF|nr:hypothetical protein [uncultured Vibrio sp.]